MTAASTIAANDNRPAEFDARVMSYMPGLRRLAARLTPAGEREDLIQDTLIYALGNWQKFRPDGGFYNWLCLNMRSIAQGKRGTAESRARRVPMDDDPDGIIMSNVAVPATQEAAVDVATTLRRLSRSREGRILVRLGMGDTLAEIGKRRGIGRERVRQLAERGRADLRAAA